MTDKKRIKEIGMVSSIIGDAIMENLQNELRKNGTGPFAAYEKIADWAEEFVDKHENTDWEKVIEEGIDPLSSKVDGEIICWDDCVFDWAHYKLEELIKR